MRIVFKSPKNERFLVIQEEKLAYFLRCSRKKLGGEEAAIFSCLDKTKYERFFFSKHPLSRKREVPNSKFSYTYIIFSREKERTNLTNSFTSA